MVACDPERQIQGLSWGLGYPVACPRYVQYVQVFATTTNIITPPPASPATPDARSALPGTAVTISGLCRQS